MHNLPPPVPTSKPARLHRGSHLSYPDLPTLIICLAMCTVYFQPRCASCSHNPEPFLFLITGALFDPPHFSLYCTTSVEAQIHRTTGQRIVARQLDPAVVPIFFAEFIVQWQIFSTTSSPLFFLLAALSYSAHNQVLTSSLSARTRSPELSYVFRCAPAPPA